MKSRKFYSLNVALFEQRPNNENSNEAGEEHECFPNHGTRPGHTCWEAGCFLLTLRPLPER